MKKIVASSLYGQLTMGKQYFILQWGYKRSVIMSLKNNKVLIIKNDYLMYLDKKGLVV